MSRFNTTGKLVPKPDTIQLSRTSQVFQGAREMRKLILLPAALIALVAFTSGKADAAYCGAACYDGCGSAVSDGVGPATHTVMKTVRRTVYEQQTQQRTRTEYQTVTEQGSDLTRMQRETRYRTVNSVVRKPVYETKFRTYTVNQAVVFDSNSSGYLQRTPSSN